MILLITFSQDLTAGLYQSTFEIPCPFDSDADEETKTLFLVAMVEIYKDYCETSINAQYK